MTREGIDRFAAVGVHINAREALADELVSNDLASGVDRRASAMDRGRTLWVPAGALLPHVLDAHGLGDSFCHHGRIHRRIISVTPAVGARAHRPDRTDFIRWNAEHVGNAVTHKMRLL